MKLYIKQKVFSFSDSYDIFDQNYEPIYHVESQIFSFLPKIYLKDVHGNELFYIERKLKLFLAGYEIYYKDNLVANVKQNFKFLGSSFAIESQHGLFEMEGDLMSHDFIITLNGDLFGSVSKEWLTWGDSYILDVVNEDDAAFFASLVVTIDNALHNNSSNNNA